MPSREKSGELLKIIVQESHLDGLPHDGIQTTLFKHIPGRSVIYFNFLVNSCLKLSCFPKCQIRNSVLDHTTNHQLASVTRDIEDSLSQKESTNGRVLFEEEKVFDTVWHNGLHQTLHAFNFPTYLVKIIHLSAIGHIEWKWKVNFHCFLQYTPSYRTYNYLFLESILNG